MMKIKYILFAFICLTLTYCATEEHKFPLDKRYWDTNDYDKVILELRYGYENDERKPTFDSPEQRIIVQKLTDEQNFKIVLNDKELGLKHKNDLATEFFNHWKDIESGYGDQLFVKHIKVGWESQIHQRKENDEADSIHHSP